MSSKLTLASVATWAQTSRPILAPTTAGGACTTALVGIQVVGVKVATVVVVELLWTPHDESQNTVYEAYWRAPPTGIRFLPWSR